MDTIELVGDVDEDFSIVENIVPDDHATIANLLPALNPDMMPVPGSAPREAIQEAVTILQEALDEAERLGDLARAESARQDRDAIIEELAKATGLGGMVKT